VRDIRCIVPSEGFLLAIRPVFHRYAPLLPIKPDPELIYGSLSKSVVIARLLDERDRMQLTPEEQDHNE